MMIRPLKTPKMNDEKSVNYDESESEAMNLAVAAATLECRSALVNSRSAARAALTKHRSSIAHELAQALETVESYTTNERGRTALHEAVIDGDATMVEALLVAGAKIDAEDLHGATPYNLATENTCRKILENHAAVYSSILVDPTTLVTSAYAHCATLAAAEQLVPSSTLFLRAHHLDPSFLWAPPAARSAVVAWARNACIAQYAGTTPPFRRLPDDCAGDVLEFTEMGMTHEESVQIAKHCSSSEARAWVCAVVAGAVVAKATAELESAAGEGDLASVQECLSRWAIIDNKVDGRTALINASGNGHTAIVQVLVDAGADKEAKDDKYGNTALIEASFEGQAAIVQLLIKAGADKEAKDNYGSTALMNASAHDETALVLVGAGANMEAKDLYGRTPLIAASMNNHRATVLLLLLAGSNKEATNNSGRTALIWASHKGCIATVTVLLDFRAEKEAKDNDGRTALLCASFGGCAAIVQLLIEAGADMGATANDGRTLLMYASQRGHNDTVRVLMELGADMEVKDEDGRTALFWASYEGHADTVQLLLQAGANKEATNNNGNTALDLANERGHTAVVALLED